MIFIGLIISLLALLIIWLIKKWDWRVCLIFLGITFVANLLLSGISYLAGTRQDVYAEVWNYKTNKVCYYESWDEEVSCRHPVYREERHRKTRRVTDSKGREHTEVYYEIEKVIDHYRHPYDVDWHNPYWEAVDEYGSSYEISENDYNQWKSVWRNNNFVELNRHYHSKDGNEYVSTWNGELNKIRPIESIHNYENKIRVSNSLFSYKEMDKDTVDKYYRPADKDYTGAIISYDGTSFSEDENLFLRQVNASLGSAYKVHCLVVLWDGTKTPRSEMEDVMAAWKGPNKNELIIGIGMDKDRQIIWCDCWSWMEDTTVHALIRNDLLAAKRLDIHQLGEMILKRVPEKWAKRNFHDFDYINNPLPTTCYVVVFIGSILISIGGFFLVEKATVC